jgi:hypothetical protein
VAWSQPPASGFVRLVSSRTFDEIYTVSPGEPGDAFGLLIGGGDFFSRTDERDLVIGAPGARAAADGGPPHGSVWAVDADTGELLASIDGDDLAGGPVWHLGQSIGVLGHPTRTAQAWWALGAPGAPGAPTQGVVIVTGDEALSERYRLRGPRGALFGWMTFTLASDVDGDGPATLEFVVTAPLEGRKGRLAEAGAVSLYSAIDGRRLWKVRGPHRKARFGYSAFVTTDSDGDGVNDFWVGAPGSPSEGVSGAVFLLSGRDGSRLQTVNAPPGADLFGFGLQPVGDVDADARQDFMISAPGAARGRRQQAGSVYLRSGATGEWLAEWHGRAAGQRLGVALGAGATGDGAKRWALIGSVLDRGGAPGRGRADVYSPYDRRNVSFTGTVAGQYLGASVRGLPDADGDSWPDLLIASPGAPPIFVPE